LLVVGRGADTTAATITETEAYLGAEDPASHAFRGPTPRARIMFGPPGRAYVYLSYGVHHCLNAVTEAEGSGGAVLLRAVSPEVPAGFTGVGLEPRRLSGPGLLCRALGIDLRYNGADLVDSELRILPGAAVPDERVVIGPRVGISRARDLPLRFRLAG